MAADTFSLPKAIEGYVSAGTATARRDAFSVMKAQFAKQALCLTRGHILHLYKGALCTNDFSEVRAVSDLLAGYVSQHRSYDTTPVVQSIVGATGIMANALLRVDAQDPYPTWEGERGAWSVFVCKTQISLFETLDDMMQDARTGCTPRHLAHVALDSYLCACNRNMREEIADKAKSALINVAWLFPDETQRALDKRIKKVGPDAPERDHLSRAVELVNVIIL